jgi:hypothetical protein
MRISSPEYQYVNVRTFGCRWNDWSMNDPCGKGMIEKAYIDPLATA